MVRIPQQIKTTTELKDKYDSLEVDAKTKLIQSTTEHFNGVLSGVEIKTVFETLEEINNSSVFVGTGYNPERNGIYINNPESQVFQYCIFSTDSVKTHSLERSDIVEENYIFGVFSRIKRKGIRELNLFLEEVSDYLTEQYNEIELTLGNLNLSRLGRTLTSISMLLDWIQYSRDIDLTIKFEGNNNPIGLMALCIGALSDNNTRINQCFQRFKSDKPAVKKGAISDILNNRKEYYPMLTDIEIEEILDRKAEGWRKYINNGYISQT
jgi:hypothetical protein